MFLLCFAVDVGKRLAEIKEDWLIILVDLIGLACF